MRKSKSLRRMVVVFGAASLVLLTLSGCGTVGPQSLSRGRVAYNEVLTETNAEQSLAYIVRMRYGVMSSLLSVSSITANIRFRADAGVNIGLGSQSNYEGNLVPLSGGLAYEENPTISYVPVQGEEKLQSLLSPISIDLLIPFINSAFSPSNALILLVSRINRIPNRAFISTANRKEDHRFEHLCRLINGLSRGDALRFVLSAGEEKRYYLWIHDYAPDFTDLVEELLDTLRISGVSTGGADIFLPIVPFEQRESYRSISIEIRSIHSVAQIASATVDVPEEDLVRGVTYDFPKLGLVGDIMRVHRSKKRPVGAVCKTRYLDWWYYVADNDSASKQSFGIFQALMAHQLAETTETRRTAPALTIPISN